MNEQQKAQLDDMLKVRLSFRDIIQITSVVEAKIEALQEEYEENPFNNGIVKDSIQEHKVLRKKLESIWDTMRNREMTPNEYLERFQEI